MERSQTIRRCIAAILTVMLIFTAMPIQVIAEKNDHTITVSSENGVIEKAAKPKSIKITGSRYVAKGKKIILKATVSPAGASQKVTWKSANKKIAMVSSSGVVKGIKSGKVKITGAVETTPVVVVYPAETEFRLLYDLIRSVIQYLFHKKIVLPWEYNFKPGNFCQHTRPYICRAGSQRSML